MSCDVGGCPGTLFVSPDGSQLFVFDEERAQISVIGIPAWQVLDRMDLNLPSASASRFLAGYGDSIFFGGLAGKVGVFSAASRRAGGAILCTGDACDMKILPELRQAVLTTSSGNTGFLELLALVPFQTVARMELPLPPVRETLAVLPKLGLGAVVLRDS